MKEEEGRWERKKGREKGEKEKRERWERKGG
jgi:hypothetical protein